MDWNAIKTEYITNPETSYRKLAKKYGVNPATISKKASAENWVEERKQFAIKTQAKTVEKISRQKATRAAKIQTVADKLLNKIEFLASLEGMAPKDIRALVAAVKDLKEIQNVRSDLDEQEQKARIANLQRQAPAHDDEDEGTGVVLLPPVLVEDSEE